MRVFIDTVTESFEFLSLRTYGLWVQDADWHIEIDIVTRTPRHSFPIPELAFPSQILRPVTAYTALNPDCSDR